MRKLVANYRTLRRGVAGISLVALLSSCATAEYELTEPPNYDHLIGRNFSESIYKGREIYKLVRITDSVEELENRRSDGCILVFGVRKTNDVIEYWRVDSGPGTCFTRKKALNR